MRWTMGIDVGRDIIGQGKMPSACLNLFLDGPESRRVSSHSPVRCDWRNWRRLNSQGAVDSGLLVDQHMCGSDKCTLLRIHYRQTGSVKSLLAAVALQWIRLKSNQDKLSGDFRGFRLEFQGAGGAIGGGGVSWWGWGVYSSTSAACVHRMYTTVHYCTLQLQYIVGGAQEVRVNGTYSTAHAQMCTIVPLSTRVAIKPIWTPGCQAVLRTYIYICTVWAVPACCTTPEIAVYCNQRLHPALETGHIECKEQPI